MENKLIKEKLIQLIKNFNSTCPKCGKLFLGALVEGSHKSTGYLLDVGNKKYPLSCGRCPNCARECYNNLENYLEQYNKAPCLGYEEEFMEKGDILAELDCWIYMDEDQSYLGDLTIIEQGKLIDLFEVLIEHID